MAVPIALSVDREGITPKWRKNPMGQYTIQMWKIKQYGINIIAVPVRAGTKNLGRGCPG